MRPVNVPARSAELSRHGGTVPQNAILREPRSFKPGVDVERFAECNSAAQQSETLRYFHSEFDVPKAALVLIASIFFLVCGGCVSKSQAQAQARLAYMAGQRDAFAQMQHQQAEPDIKFIGPVKNQTVKWFQGLTLAKAILTAGYNSSTDPQFIIIRRLNQEIQIDPKRLLNGDDIPLEAGDVVEFRMPE